ncbi:MAG: GNAT superfamily N-acetyltransferase [Glaciecola sp.]
MNIEGMRVLTAADSAEVTELVAGIYAEYPGCVLDLPGVDDDLPALADRLQSLGGQGWAVQDGTDLVACVGWAPHGHGTAELKRLYVASGARGRGLGAGLVGHITAVAAEAGVRWLELWSDTRFTDAHRLYERCGFTRLPESRDLHDPSHTTEFHYLRDLDSSG